MTRLITSKVVMLARQYLSDPAPFWGGVGDRQIRKLKAMMRTWKAGERSNIDVIDEVLSLSYLRTLYAPPPIYIANIGSSGSHWLEAMLSRCTTIINCGEVYLPQGLLKALEELAAAERAYFLHALYAVHSGRRGNELLVGRFTNSAHYSKISRVADLAAGSSTVLLVRHPVDIALSRTLRKQEYRDDVAPGLSDMAYLEHNCVLIERFYGEALGEAFDARVRYEDLITRPQETLQELTDQLKLNTDSCSIAAAVSATDSKAVTVAAARGERAPTNLYLGDNTSVPVVLLDASRARLARCAEQLGYDVKA
jgi:hypothetical protein